MVAVVVVVAVVAVVSVVAVVAVVAVSHYFEVGGWRMKHLELKTKDGGL